MHALLGMEQAQAQAPPRLRWPLVLMLLAAVVSVILVAIVMNLPPSGVTR
jgi:hypothetical protein